MSKLIENISVLKKKNKLKCNGWQIIKNYIVKVKLIYANPYLKPFTSSIIDQNGYKNLCDLHNFILLKAAIKNT